MSLLIDTGNLYYCLRKKYGESATLDYAKYLEAVEESFAACTTKIAYVSCYAQGAEHFATFLNREFNFQVIKKKPRVTETQCDCGKRIKSVNFNVELTMDAIKVANNLETMIIGSADYNLLALLEKLKPATGVLCVYAAGIPSAFGKYAHVKEISRELLRDNALATK